MNNVQVGAAEHSRVAGDSKSRAMKTKIAPIRILTAVPICDGHDSAINTINLELVHNGIEVVYLGKPPQCRYGPVPG